MRIKCRSSLAAAMIQRLSSYGGSVLIRRDGTMFDCRGLLIPAPRLLAALPIKNAPLYGRN